jgi:hypothetical protein
MFDRFHLTAAEHSIGPRDSLVRLSPDWRGKAPVPTTISVVERRGVDLNPLNPKTDSLRLSACLWPDRPERATRLRAALAIAEAEVDRGGRLAERLASGRVQSRLRYHCLSVFSKTVAGPH